jgi:hypothetical protein
MCCNNGYKIQNVEVFKFFLIKTDFGDIDGLKTYAQEICEYAQEVLNSNSDGPAIIRRVVTIGLVDDQENQYPYHIVVTLFGQNEASVQDLISDIKSLNQSAIQSSHVLSAFGMNDGDGQWPEALDEQCYVDPNDPPTGGGDNNWG